MKTSEFIKRVEELGYRVLVTSEGVTVHHDYKSVAIVYKNSSKSLDTNWDDYISDELFDVLVEYARTPIEERKDVKKYYLYNPVKKSYFNYFVKDGTYRWASPSQTYLAQTKFTEEEIKSHKFRDIMELLIKEEVE